MISDDWLMVEALWNAVIVEGTEAGRAAGSGKARLGRQHARRAVAHCEMARSILAAAPVNAVELAEDCRLAASFAAEPDGQVWWARWVAGQRAL